MSLYRRTRFLWLVLTVLGGMPCTAICQFPADPPGLPSEPPVYECEAMYVPIMVYARTPNPALAGWVTADRARHSSLAISGADLNESVLTLTLTKFRHRPLLPPNGAQPNDPKREFGGRAWRLGESRGRNNEPIYGLPEIDTGWFDDVDRVDCLKTWAVPSSAMPPIVRDRYEGEPSMRTLGTGPGEQWPYAAMCVRLKVQGGHVIGAALDTDYGIDCVPAYSGAHACTNPACARFGICAVPWVYPNVPCGTCGAIGRDATREDLFVARHASWNMLPDAQGDRWQRITPLPAINTGATIAQMHTTAGTPYMAFSLIQERAYSTSPHPYSPPDRAVPEWNDGVYFVYLDRVKIRKGSSALGVYADLRIRMWRLYDFSTAGAFAYIADWFDARSTCDLDGDQCVAVPDLFAFLTAWFGG